MARVQHDSPKKNRLIGAIQAGKTVSEAAEMVAIPTSTARDIWRKYKTTGSTKNQPRSGRPVKVTARTERMLMRHAQNNRRKPFRELANELDLNVSVSTVRRHLGAHGYHRRVARKVPLLKEVQKRKRLAWAEEQKGFDVSKVIYSDECYIYLGDRCGRVYVTCCADEKFEEECLIPMFKQSSVRIMIWACIIKGKKGPLTSMEYQGGKKGGITAKIYQEQVLEPMLLPFWTEMESERGNVCFQHDGAPSHTAKTTKKWLADHNIPVFPHPPSSPDLNPIEPVWNVLKTKIRALPHSPTTAQGLIKAVQDVWAKLDVRDVDRFIDRMGEIVDAVLDARGGHTRF